MGSPVTRSSTFDGRAASRKAARVSGLHPSGFSIRLPASPRKKTVRMPMVARRLRDPDINPCLLESDASTRCMDENNYDREMCSIYFLKYKNCRKFWNSVMVQRRQNGVKPPMPTAAERNEILGAMGKMPY
ncbi:coiled-coil-helix-coiled-coil-helix domain-containing protein 7 isoform X1 [Myotis lucifugus]|nr:coiled-coil-helix-coiled-coil-helix domain-containing protein 7 isoform X1 [Myotis lucifugus]